MRRRQVLGGIFAGLVLSSIGLVGALTYTNGSSICPPGPITGPHPPA